MKVVPVDKKIVAQNLKKLRKSRFASREEFCELLGMSVSRYAEYEMGRVSLPFEVGWLIADIFGCPMDEVGGRQWTGDMREEEITPDDEQPAPQSHDDGDDADEPQDRMDDGAMMLAERIAKLPEGERKAIQDFLSFQESQAEKSRAVSCDVGRGESRVAAS